MPKSPLRAGAASIDILPPFPVHLAGYPHVRRDSTGVHDPLLSCALYLESAGERALIVANDVIYVSKTSTARCRQEISTQTGIHPQNILISATHTHSGPKMLDPLATSADDVVPKTDPRYVRLVEDKIILVASRAVTAAVPADVGLAITNAEGVGTNRRDPKGAKDLAVPVLVVRASGTQKPLAVMVVCSMHPTVLHEDSTLVSGDFPAMARQQLQQNVFGPDCVILYHTGPAGNQSPRHVTRANTFDEAKRLGGILADAVAKAARNIRFANDVAIECRSTSVQLPLRTFPSETDAQAKLTSAIERLSRLRATNAPRVDVRTAEVDWFGAEETLTLARAAADGRLQQAAASVMPAEVQLIRIGDWNFIAWPGEMFVEFALEVKKRSPDTFIISYANGELQGYIVTKEAVDEGGYESSNAIFKSPESGEILLQKTFELLR